MMGFMQTYIRRIDSFNRGLGRIVMYGIFVMMGILLFSFGMMNLIVYKISGSDPKTYKNILLLNCVLSLISFILSVRYFFVVPVVLMGIAILSFFGILVKNVKKEKE